MIKISGKYDLVNGFYQVNAENMDSYEDSVRCVYAIHSFDKTPAQVIASLGGGVLVSMYTKLTGCFWLLSVRRKEKKLQSLRISLPPR